MKKRRNPPSRVRYEKSHPVVSARLDMDHYKKLKEILKTEKNSFAEFLRGIVDKAEIEYGIGYDVGARDWQIWYYCNICGKRIGVKPEGESHKALIRYMKEHGWGHTSCHEKDP